MVCRFRLAPGGGNGRDSDKVKQRFTVGPEKVRDGFEGKSLGNHENRKRNKYSCKYPEGHRKENRVLQNCNTVENFDNLVVTASIMAEREV